RRPRPLPTRLPLQARRRPAPGHRAAGRGLRERPRPPDAAGRHGVGQDLHDRQRDRAGAEAHAGHGAQQDAGGAAVRGVQVVLPAQRGRVLRQLLRLLPAGSLRRGVGHLHREGQFGERAHRADAAVGDQGAAGAAGRDHRLHGLGHLRPGRSERVLPDGAAHGPGRADRPARADPPPDGDAVHPQRDRAAPGYLPGARRRGRHPSGGERRRGGADRAVRREIENVTIFDPLTGETLRRVPRYTIYPGSHYVTTRRTVLDAVNTIKEELRERLEQLYAANKLVEAQRLAQRTQFDLEMLAEVGYCNGVENYSRHLTGHMPGEPPPCLFDYLPPDALLVVDESHVTVPQVGAMYKGDRSRKETLVEFGFRLPSALDNRPLKFEEWEGRSPRAIFVSATPGKYELEHSGGE